MKKRTWLDEVRYFGFYIWWNWITDLKWKLPNIIQRAYYGVGYADVWSFDTYLCDVIIRGLKIQIENRYHIDPTEEQYQKMINTFELHLKQVDYKLLDKEEQKQYKEGWKLFQKYFGYLWD